MSLARMLSACPDELECDFLQVYRISDLRQISPHKAAVLACGLNLDSRTAAALSQSSLTFSETLAAASFDRLGLLLYIAAKSAGLKHFPKPDSLLGELENTSSSPKCETFDSGEELLSEYNRLCGSG